MQIPDAPLNAERQRHLLVDEPGLFNQELAFGVSPALAQSATLPKHRKLMRPFCNQCENGPALGERAIARGPAGITLQLENLATP
jgi:hypothetical protein